MQKDREDTAGYRVLPDMGGTRYRFFCGLSGMAVYTSSPIESCDGAYALAEAWEQARPHFNRCPRCGRWVSDLMFHPAADACVACAPWETEPRFCPRCGAETKADSWVCETCGLILNGPKGE